MSISPAASARAVRSPTRRRARAAAGAVAAAVVLAGCSLFGSDGDTPTATTTAPSTTSTTAAPTARSQPPELLDAGDEPRQALRVAYTEGDTAEITFTSDIEIAQESDGRIQRIDSPPVAQVLTYTVGTVTDAGAELTVRIDSIAAKGKGTGMTEEELAAFDEELAPLAGIEGTTTVTPLGEIDAIAFDVPDDLPEALAAQIEALEDQLPALGPAFPAQAVGVGASWRTTSTSSTGGAEVETVSTITVTAIGEGTVEYRADIRVSAEPQAIELTGLPEGTTARLDSSVTTGSSTGTMGLDRPDLALRTGLTGEQQITLTSDTATTELTQTIDTAYVVATAPD